MQVTETPKLSRPDFSWAYLSLNTGFIDYFRLHIDIPLGTCSIETQSTLFLLEGVLCSAQEMDLHRHRYRHRLGSIFHLRIHLPLRSSRATVDS